MTRQFVGVVRKAGEGGQKVHFAIWLVSSLWVEDGKISHGDQRTRGCAFETELQSVRLQHTGDAGRKPPANPAFRPPSRANM